MFGLWLIFELMQNNLCK